MDKTFEEKSVETAMNAAKRRAVTSSEFHLTCLNNSICDVN